MELSEKMCRAISLAKEPGIAKEILKRWYNYESLRTENVRLKDQVEQLEVRRAIFTRPKLVAIVEENARLKELLKVPDELVELSLMSDADSKNKFTDRAISLTLGLIARQEGDSDAATKTKAMLQHGDV